MPKPRHPDNYDRTSRLAAPLRPRPPWECSEWWLVRAHELPEQVCGKCAAHGPVTLSLESTRVGRTLAYHCRVCGWLSVVLVQEGQDAPTAPLAALPPPAPMQLARSARMRELSALGHAARRAGKYKPRTGKRHVNMQEYE